MIKKYVIITWSVSWQQQCKCSTFSPHFMGPYIIDDTSVPSRHLLVENQQKKQQSKLTINTLERRH